MSESKAAPRSSRCLLDKVRVLSSRERQQQKNASSGARVMVGGRLQEPHAHPKTQFWRRQGIGEATVSNLSQGKRAERLKERERIQSSLGAPLSE